MKIGMIGGFLGSGKTTAIISAAKVLIGQGLTVGVITNDQGKYLVDTHFMRLEDIPAVEVNGGCFCCNYTDFDESLDKLVAQLKPDVVFAESVGSCADVVATVMRPLLQYRQQSAAQLSLSVFTDARLLRAYLDGQELPFQDGVMYVFEKQIEEANLLIINKADLLKAAQLQALIAKVSQKYPDKIIIPQNSLTPQGVKPWLARLAEEDGFPLKQEALSINYQVYGAGEQVLAWYDGIYELGGDSACLVAWVNKFIETVRQKLTEQSIPVGHLKLLVSDPQQHQKISLTSTSDGEAPPRMSNLGWQAPLQLLVNARLECSQPEIMNLIGTALEETQDIYPAALKILDEEAFHPGFPAPTHRLI